MSCVRCARTSRWCTRTSPRHSTHGAASGDTIGEPLYGAPGSPPGALLRAEVGDILESVLLPSDYARGAPADSPWPPPAGSPGVCTCPGTPIAGSRRTGRRPRRLGPGSGPGPVRRPVRRIRLGCLFSRHELVAVHQVADLVAVLCQGAVVETRPVAEVLAAQHPDCTCHLLEAVPIPDPTRRVLSATHPRRRMIASIFDSLRWARRIFCGKRQLGARPSAVKFEQRAMRSKGVVQVLRIDRPECIAVNSFPNGWRIGDLGETGSRTAGPPVHVVEPAARFRSVLSGSALVSASPLRTLAALIAVVAGAIAHRAGSAHALVLALLLLLPFHLLGHFLRRFLRLFSHLHSVLSEVLLYSPNHHTIASGDHQWKKNFDSYSWSGRNSTRSSSVASAGTMTRPSRSTRPPRWVVRICGSPSQPL